MKAMKTLLCIVLSLAMVLGMSGAFAEALLDGGVTLRNVVLTIGEDEFALSQQARILANADEDSAALRFEIVNGDNVLLPVAGEIDETGVRFTLDDSGRVYSLDMAMIQEAIALDAETLALLEDFGGLFPSLAAAMEALDDPANEEALLKWSESIVNAMFGEPAEVEMDINGASYPGVEVKGALTLNNLLSVVELYENTGIAEYDQFWKDYIALMSKASGLEISSLADLKTLMLEDGVTEEDLNQELGAMEMTIGGDDSVTCVRMNMTMAADGEDAVMAMEVIETAENADMTMTMEIGDGEDAISEAAFTCSMDLSGEEVTAVDAAMDIYSGSSYTYDDGYVSDEASTVSLALTAGQAEGLWSGSLDVAGMIEETYGYEGEEEIYSDSFGFAATLEQAPAEDDTIVSAISLAAIAGDETYGVAFEIKPESASGLTALVGENTTVYPLTDNMEDAAYTMLSADAMSLMADVMELGADETIISLAEAFSSMAASAYDEYAYEDGYYEDEYYDEGYYDESYEDYSDYETAYTTVSTFEEAAEIYPGLIPSFTAPEGYALSYIDVSAEDLYAEYVTADGYDFISMYVIDFGTELGNEVSYYDNGEGSIVGAEVLNGSTYVSFYFVVDSEAEAEAIVSGLSF